MCEKCAELDRKIVHLRRLVENLTDPGTINAAKNMIKEMEAEKAQHHLLVDHE
jgi:hypothetical protein